jgi:hypothetical protein
LSNFRNECLGTVRPRARDIAGGVVIFQLGQVRSNQTINE